MTNFKDLNSALNSKTPFEVAGIGPRIAAAAADAEQLVDLTRSLLRAEAAMTHSDVIHSNVSERGQQQRLTAINAALSDLKDEPSVLRGMANDYILKRPPLSVDIEKVHFSIAQTLEIKSKYIEFFADRLHASVEMNVRHPVRCEGMRLKLSDPLETIKGLRKESALIEKKNNTALQQQLLAKHKLGLTFPDAETRQFYRQKAISDERLDLGPEYETDWVLKQIEKNHPKIFRQSEFGSDFPKDLIERYRELYQKSDVGIAYNALIDGKALALWANAVEYEITLQTSDDQNASMTRREGLEDNLLRSGADFEPIIRSQFYLEIQQNGDVYRITKGVREHLTGTTILGTVGVSTSFSATAWDQGNALSDFYFGLFGSFPPADISILTQFEAAEFVSILIRAFTRNYTSTLGNEIAVSQNVSEPVYLIGIVASGDEPAHFEVLGEVWGIEPINSSESIAERSPIAKSQVAKTPRRVSERNRADSKGATAPKVKRRPKK